MSEVGQKLEFEIDHIDPLGQGVYKTDGKINFIAKTLPGEAGHAEVIKSKKGVAFASVQTLETKAPNRIEPECPHYGECPGCDFLHTDYQSEIAYKSSALNKLLKDFLEKDSVVEMVPAPRRLAYRNRIQLHYQNSKIGLIDGLLNQLVEIPQCRILRDELQPALASLYEDKRWSKNHTGKGHCELYLHKGELRQSWDEPYSLGGFSQVFDEMNEALRNAVARYLPVKQVNTLLDLFAGDGNLSELIVHAEDIERVMVDYQTPPSANELVNTDKYKEPNFVAIDLFADGALKSFQRRCKTKQFDVLLVDPPRRGFPELNQWLKRYKSSYLVYVSCNPATLARDLGNLDGKFSLDHLMLLDLFPGTHHFETVAFIALK